MSEEKLYKQLLLSIQLFFAVWIVGGIGYFILGLIYAKAVPADEAYSFSFLNCFYMSAITTSTVGYGEVTNFHTNLEGDGETVGTVYTMVFCLVSYLAIVYASANIVAALVEGAVGKMRYRKKMEKKLAALEDHYIVCGAGSTGRHIIDELLKTGNTVVVIDVVDHEGEAWHKEEHSFALVGDATEDEILEQAGLPRAKGIFASLQDDKDNLFIALTAKQAKSNIRVVGRASEKGTVAKLKAVGAEAVVSPNHIGGLRMASEMIRPGVVSFLDTMLRKTDSTLRFSEVRITDEMEAAGKRLSDLNTAAAVGVNVIGIYKADQTIVYNPRGNTVVESGDALIVICDTEALQRLELHTRSGVTRFTRKLQRGDKPPTD